MFSPEELRKLKALKTSLPYFSKNCLKIKTKDAKIIPFKFNRSQEYFHKICEEEKKKNGRVRIVVVKGRQSGISTYVAARFYHRTSTSKAINTFILSHESSTTDKLFTIVKLYNEHNPVAPATRRSNAKELSFSTLDSQYYIGTAGSGDVGRGGTVHLFHGCLSADSLIVSENGNSIAMGDIKIGDTVLTSSGVLSKVKNKVYTGEKQTYTLDVWCSGEPVHVTRDHKILTDNGYKELKNLTTKDYVAMPKIDPGEEIEFYEHRYRNKPRKQGGGSKSLSYANIPLNKLFGYVIGYYLAKGHVKANGSSISFTYHEDEKYIDAVLKTIAPYISSYTHKNYSESKRKTTNVYGRFFCSFINDICGRVDKKHIPDWFFKTNKSFLEGVLCGYLDGNGSKTQDDKVSASSIHESITRQIQRIYWALYGAASVSKHKKERDSVSTKDIYLFRASGNPFKKYKGSKSGNRKEKSFIKDGVVYCRIKSITQRKIEPVYDIEIDHSDHDYQTTACVVSNSEVAFWKNTDEIETGLMESIPEMDNSEIILESTANGFGNYFYRMSVDALKGLNGYRLVFIPWHWTDEYEEDVSSDFILDDEEKELIDTVLKEYPLEKAKRKLAWRRMKITRYGSPWKFKQEYPTTVMEAFQTSGTSLIPTQRILLARQRQPMINNPAPLVMGVDPARNEDRAVIAFRRGRTLERVDSYKNTDDDIWFAEKIIEYIQKHSPMVVNIDCTNSWAIHDYIRNKGYGDIVRGFHFGQSATDNRLYANKRAEILCKLRDWFNEEDISIPDSDELQMDLAAIPEYDETDGKIRFVAKEKIKKQCGFSPDICDAVALTFATPINATGAVKIHNKAKQLSTLKKFESYKKR